MKKIREMVPSDKGSYMSLAKEFYLTGACLHPTDETVLLSNFAAIETGNPNIIGLMLEYDEEIAGFALLSRGFSTEVGGVVLWVEEVYVRPEYQGKGLASTFFAHIEKNYCSDVKRIRLEVARSNLRAYNLYEKKGFLELRYLQMIKDI